MALAKLDGVRAATDVVPAAPSTSPPRRRVGAGWWTVLGIMVVSAGLECWAIQRDLPFTDVDEPTFARPAVHIAATGDLNPHWFGHPGSTIIYPLAGFYRLWDTLAHGGPVFSWNQDLLHRFHASPTEFYIIGRLWTIAFALATIPLLFLLGKRVFSTRVGLVAAALWAIVPLMVQYAREVRTDSAGVFFAVLSVLLIVRLLDRPSPLRFALAGASIGLGIASRYFLVTLVPVLIAAGVIAIRRRTPRASPWGIAAGIGAAIGAFAFTTPYFFLDRSAAFDSLRIENKPGAAHGGFSMLGNVRWYLVRSIPNTVTWPVVLLAFAGIVLALVRKPDARRVLLLAPCVILVLAISTSKLHWNRWPLPILPLLMIFAASALVAGASAIAARWGRHLLTPAVVAGAVILAVAPARWVVEANLLDARPSTRVIAREWIRAHLPRGSTVARELKTAPLEGTGLRVTYRPALPLGGWTIDRYRRDGVAYLMTDVGISGPYTTQPHRYPREAGFYRNLRRQACLLHEFRPDADHGGPTIRLYQLPPVAGRCGMSALISS